MRIYTDLYGKENYDILASVIGQLSDGIWENSPSCNKYWRNSDIEIDESGEVVINTASWLFKSEEDAKKYFANKIKEIVKREQEYYPNIDWSRMCDTILCYFHGNTTVAKAYFAYDTLLSRNTYKFVYSF